MTAGPFWGGVVEVYKEEERGPTYAQFLEKAARHPLIVGAHWFQYLDQPASGRLLDGENGHLGLVAITDRPWQGFVEQVRKAQSAVAELAEGPGCGTYAGAFRRSIRRAPTLRRVSCAGWA